DKYDDLLIGVKSAAIRLGEQTKPVLTVFTGAMAAGLLLSGHLSDMTWPYYVAVALTTGRLAQQVRTRMSTLRFHGKR
ncbi:4-hydroxybenzoate polyprenyltransferase, mitochondrial, partial [Elysia marginata]